MNKDEIGPYDYVDCGCDLVCGCRQHTVHSYQNVVYWRGRHWDALCALTKALELLKIAEGAVGG